MGRKTDLRKVARHLARESVDEKGWEKVRPFAPLLCLSESQLRRVYWSTQRRDLASQIHFALYIAGETGTSSRSDHFYLKTGRPWLEELLRNPNTLNLARIYNSEFMGPSAEKWRRYLAGGGQDILTKIQDVLSSYTHEETSYVPRIGDIPLDWSGKEPVRINSNRIELAIPYYFGHIGGSLPWLISEFYVRYLRQVAYIPTLFELNATRHFEIINSKGVSSGVHTLFEGVISPGEVGKLQVSSAYALSPSSLEGVLPLESLPKKHQKLAIRTLFKAGRADLLAALLKRDYGSTVGEWRRLSPLILPYTTRNFVRFVEVLVKHFGVTPLLTTWEFVEDRVVVGDLESVILLQERGLVDTDGRLADIARDLGWLDLAPRMAATLNGH